MYTTVSFILLCINHHIHDFSDLVYFKLLENVIEIIALNNPDLQKDV